jgi:hypothetical protein
LPSITLHELFLGRVENGLVGLDEVSRPGHSENRRELASGGVPSEATTKSFDPLLQLDYNSFSKGRNPDVLALDGWCTGS